MTARLLLRLAILGAGLLVVGAGILLSAWVADLRTWWRLRRLPGCAGYVRAPRPAEAVTAPGELDGWEAGVWLQPRCPDAWLHARGPAPRCGSDA